MEQNLLASYSNSFTALPAKSLDVVLCRRAEEQGETGARCVLVHPTTAVYNPAELLELVYAILDKGTIIFTYLITFPPYNITHHAFRIPFMTRVFM